MQSKLDSLLLSFEQSYPGFAKFSIGYELSGDNSIIIELDTGRKIEYHRGLNTIMYVNEELLYPKNECEWRRRFQYLLNKKMSDACIDIPTLSERTGIGVKTIYNYLGQQSTPSCWYIKRIADALGCDVNELM